MREFFWHKVKSTAHHEAGHAVALLLLGGRVDEVIVDARFPTARTTGLHAGVTGGSGVVGSAEGVVAMYGGTRAASLVAQIHFESSGAPNGDFVRKRDLPYLRCRDAAVTDAIRWSIAGAVAESIHSCRERSRFDVKVDWKRYRRNGSVYDFWDVEQILSSVIGLGRTSLRKLLRDPIAVAAIREEWRRTRNALSRCWPAVERIAKYLLKRGFVEGHERIRSLAGRLPRVAIGIMNAPAAWMREVHKREVARARRKVPVSKRR